MFALAGRSGNAAKPKFWRIQMKFKLTILMFAAVICQAPGAFGQWYANPQMTTGGNNDDTSANSMLYGGGNPYLYGGSFLPGGGGVLPGSGITSGAIAGTASDGGDASAASAGAGYQFTSDPISAYTNAAYTGMANLIRAEGSYNQSTSKAEINHEQARSLYLENQQRLFNVRRAIHRAMLAAHLEDVEYRHAKEARANAFLASHRPPPLGPKQLDPSSGQIKWPQALMESEFDDLRTKLDADFGARLRYGSDPELAARIRREVHQMQDLLHDYVLQLPIESYSQARLFLEQLSISGD